LVLSWLLFSLFERRQLNFLYFQKIDDDGQKMAKAAMALYGIDQNPGAGRGARGAGRGARGA